MITEAWDAVPCWLRRLLIAAPFAYAVYTIAACPCSFIGSCHIPQLGVALLLGLLLLLADNRSLVF